MAPIAPATATQLTGRVQRPTGRLWRIYIDGVGLQTYLEGWKNGQLPKYLIIGPWFWRNEQWERLPFALQSFLMTLRVRLNQWPDRNFQEVRIIEHPEEGFTEIWVKLERCYMVTEELADWFFELVCSLLGRPIQLHEE